MPFWKVPDRRRDPPNPRLTRLRKLRHLSDLEVGKLDFGATSNDSYGLKCRPGLRPQPLPLPQDDLLESRPSVSTLQLSSPTIGANSSCCSSSPSSPSAIPQNPASPTTPRTPTNRESLLSPFTNRNSYHYYRSSPELNPTKKSHYSKFPYKSEPTSSFSSPSNSPRFTPGITNSATATPTGAFLQVWSAPEIHSGEIGYNLNNVNVHPLPLPPGAELEAVKGQWKKGSLIGSGTFGNVYEGTNRHTGALCAMKEVTIVPGDSKSLECLKQIEQEIEFLSQFKHENIVQYYGSEIIGDRFYIYLEYVHPGSINKYVRQHCGAMTESVVRNFTRHILNGLAYLHSMKIMHRDIKGANLLVDAKGVVKLADFGMAKHLSGLAPNLSLKGTPYWMAPEVVQATMNKETGYDMAVDIWSLGCTIIEMFTGKHPWAGLEGAAAMFKVLHNDPPIPTSLSSEGKDFLKRCFRRNPAERPTAGTLLEHPFIRNSTHYSIHGSIQAFAGIKLHDAAQRKKEKSKPSKSDPAIRKKTSSSPGRANHSYSASCTPIMSSSSSQAGLPRSSPELYPPPPRSPPFFLPRSPNQTQIYSTSPRPGPHIRKEPPVPP
ncbi:hypothetical protein LUZ60_005012 [Juncus effusus]|nr:hypothetical protein LUZ60_005012 [Juncus effusus]